MSDHFSSYPRHTASRYANSPQPPQQSHEVISAAIAGATPTPTLAEVLGGVVVCSSAAPYTLTMTNVTAALLDAAPALQPLSIGQTFQVTVVSSNALGRPTLGAAAGVTIFQPAAAPLGGASCVLTYIRTGAGAWTAILI